MEHKNQDLELFINSSKKSLNDTAKKKLKYRILKCIELRLRGGFWNPQPQLYSPYMPSNMPTVIGYQTNAPIMFMPSMPTPSPVYVCSPMINPYGTSPTIIMSLPTSPIVQPLTSRPVSSRVAPTYKPSVVPPQNQVHLPPPKRISVPSQSEESSLQPIMGKWLSLDKYRPCPSVTRVPGEATPVRVVRRPVATPDFVSMCEGSDETVTKESLALVGKTQSFVPSMTVGPLTSTFPTQIPSIVTSKGMRPDTPVPPKIAPMLRDRTRPFVQHEIETKSFVPSLTVAPLPPRFPSPEKISLPSKRMRPDRPVPPKIAPMLRDRTRPTVGRGTETESFVPVLTVAPLAPGFPSPKKVSVPSKRMRPDTPIPPKVAPILHDRTRPIGQRGTETESFVPVLTVAPLAPGSKVQEMEESSVLSVEPTFLSVNASSLSDVNRTHVTPEKTIARNILNTIERNDVNEIDLKRKEQLEDEKVKRIAAEVQERRRVALEVILDEVLKGEEMPTKYKLNSAFF